MHQSNDNVDGKFGYGILCKTQHRKQLEDSERPFIADCFNYSHILDPNLKRKDITLVIHDPTEISKDIVPYLYHWNIVCIRRTMQEYLKYKYDVDAKFLFHPFYPYPVASYLEKDVGNSIQKQNTSKKFQAASKWKKEQENEVRRKIDAVSICRIDYGKNSDIIIKANRILRQKKYCERSSQNLAIKMYGVYNPVYVNDKLGGLSSFKQNYYGTFDKSFKAISSTLSKAKFVIDLSVLKDDGGGSQYTFLEAIYHNAVLIINRKWIDSVDRKYCDFQEGYNCFAVSDEYELAQTIFDNRNECEKVEKIRCNAKKMMERHLKVDWSSV